MELICDCSMASMHYDLQDIRDLRVGIDVHHQFVVELKSGHYGDTDRNYMREETAVVSADDTFKLAKRLKVSMQHISWYFYDRFSCDEECWNVNEVMNIYYSILQHLSQLGIRYRISKRDIDPEDEDNG
jgi:hypothetical protein